MKIFELYFNPEKEKKLCESFYHDPKDAYQRRVGRLYMVGEISNARKTDSPLLSNIFHAAKEKYYEDPSLSPDKALKRALKEVNEIIEKKEYIGRVSITFLSSKNFLIYMGKVGKGKVFLLSNGSVADIGKEVEESGSPVFQNIVYGKMKKKDKVVVITEEMHRPFTKGKILEKMAESSLDEEFMENISNLHKKRFPNISGAALVIDYTTSIKDESSTISPAEEKISLKEAFAPLIVRMQAIKRPSLPTKKVLLPALLALIVVLAGISVFTISKRVIEERKITAIEKIVQKTEAVKGGELDNILPVFEEAMKNLSEIDTQLARDEKKNLKNYLYELSKRENVEDPILIGEVEEFSPDSMVASEDGFYLLHENKMAVMDKNGEYEIKELQEEIILSTLSNEGVMLFSQEGDIIRVVNGEVRSSKTNLPYEDAHFIALSSFNNRAYLLEETKNEIIFYGERRPSLWIKEGEKNHGKGVDIAIDRSIFVLDEEKKIHRYYTGSYEEEINFSIYPALSSVTKIHTEIDAPLFLLEPQRVIVVNKEGELEKQIHSENFNNLKDIYISSDKKEIYLLDDKKVYLIEL